jgi:hypothetical protein
MWVDMIQPQMICFKDFPFCVVLFIVYLFWQHWDLNWGPHLLGRCFYSLSHSTSFFFFLWWVFQGRVLRTVPWARLWTILLLISASWEARITGVSHLRPAYLFILRWSLTVLCRLCPTPGLKLSLCLSLYVTGATGVTHCTCPVAFKCYFILK